MGKQLRLAGFSVSALVEAGCGDIGVLNAGYSAKELINEGYTLEDLRSVGYNSRQMLNAGYDMLQLRNGGYTARDILDGLNAREGSGHVLARLRQAGFSAIKLKEAKSNLKY